MATPDSWIHVLARSPKPSPYSSPPSNNGHSLALPHKYSLWCHDIHNNNWDLGSYNKLCDVVSVSDFWSVFNNFHKLNFKSMHFFFMKHDTDPIWEHPNNRHGGICSFKLDFKNALQLWEDLSVFMVCNSLTNLPNDINGVSFSPKSNWVIIKIWNKNGKNNVSNSLNPQLLRKYPNISTKYKANIPEY